MWASSCHPFLWYAAELNTPHVGVASRVGWAAGSFHPREGSIGVPLVVMAPDPSSKDAELLRHEGYPIADLRSHHILAADPRAASESFVSLAYSVASKSSVAAASAPRVADMPPSALLASGSTSLGHS